MRKKACSSQNGFDIVASWGYLRTDSMSHVWTIAWFMRGAGRIEKWYKAVQDSSREKVCFHCLWIDLQSLLPDSAPSFDDQDLEVQMPHSNHKCNCFHRSKILREAKGTKSQNPLSQEVSLAASGCTPIFVYCVVCIRAFFCDMLQVRRLQEEQYYLREQVGDRRLGKDYAKCLDRV